MAPNSEHEHLNKSGHDRANSSTKVAEIAIRNAYDGSDYACFERCLRGLDGIIEVHLDRTRGVAHLSYDASQTSPEKIQSDVERLGYGCDCRARADSRSHVGHPAVGDQDRAIKHDLRGEHDTHAGPAADHDAHAGHGEAMVRDLVRRFIV